VYRQEWNNGFGATDYARWARLPQRGSEPYRLRPEDMSEKYEPSYAFHRNAMFPTW
jgi:hypothetical protein